MFVFFGEVCDQGDIEACVVEDPFVARDSRSVVGVEEDDRIFCKVVGFELGEDVCELEVHDLNEVIVAGEDFSYHW